MEKEGYFLITWGTGNFSRRFCAERVGIGVTLR
jgi:hypothetical protein